MSRRQRLHSSARAACRSAVARIPRLVRISRTRPSIGSASRRSVAKVDRRRPATSKSRSAPGSRRAGRRRSRRAAPRVAARRHRVALGRLGRPRPPTVPRAVPPRPGRRPRARASARRSSSIAMPFLMLCSVLTTSPSRPTSTPTAYSSAPRRISSASAWASVDDLAAQCLRGLRQPALVDQEGRLLLGLGDDPLGLILGLLDDPLALGVDPLGRPDLFRHGDPQLVDEPQRGVLIEHHVGRERQLLAVGDQRLEALDEEDDVDRTCPPGSIGSGRSHRDDYGTGQPLSGVGPVPTGPRPLPPGSSMRRHRRTLRSP